MDRGKFQLPHWTKRAGDPALSHRPWHTAALPTPHREVGLLFKAAASKPCTAPEACTDKTETPGEIPTAHPRLSAFMSKAQVNMQNSLGKESMTDFASLQSKSAATRSEKPRATVAETEQKWQISQWLGSCRDTGSVTKLMHSFGLSA